MSALNRVVGLGVVVLGCLMAGGCSTPFLQPLYTTEHAATDPGMVGTWVSDGGDLRTQAVIGEGPGGAYRMELSVWHKDQPKSTLKIDLHLIQLEDARYADLFLAAEERDRLAVSHGLLALPVHQIMRVSREKDTMRVWSFKQTWLEEAMRQEKPGFAHERVPMDGREMVVVTAPTEDVLRLFQKHAKDPGAFGEPMVYTRSGG